MSTTLSTIAQRLADEIRAQDWSDAHTRGDGARHDRLIDGTRTDQLDPKSTNLVLMNVVWVTGQALAEDDPHFNIRAYAKACGVSDDWLLTRRGEPSGVIEAGIRPRRSRVVWEA